MTITTKRRVIALLFSLTFALAPVLALAQTAEDDWQAYSTFDLSSSEDSYTLNVEACRDEVEDADEQTFTFSKISGTFGPDPKYSIKIALGNETCDESVLEEVAGDTCITEVEEEDLTEGILPIEITVDFDRLTSAKTPDQCEDLEESSVVYLIIEDTGIYDDDDNIYVVEFTNEFTTTRPSSPANIEIVTGEQTAELTWDEIDGIDEYKIYYSTDTFSPGTRPETLSVSSHTVEDSSSGTVSGLSANTDYFFTVVAVDDDDNESLIGEVHAASTGTVDDFWERYSSENDIDSGHCFIATAAYGSYQEDHVQVLRDFRDQYLLTHTPGRLFVSTYYSLSPPVADYIAAHDSLRSLTRVALSPLYFFSILLLYTTALGKVLLLLALGLFIRLLWHFWPGGYRSQNHRSQSQNAQPRWVWASIAAILTLSLALPAQAEESSVDMMIELKAGSYSMDGLGDTYKLYFGEESLAIFELELDWQFYRGIGSAAIGASFGYTGVSGHALTPENQEAIDDTSLDIMPLRLMLIYRFDYLAQELDFPIALYVKGGFNYYLWWINDGSDEVATNAEGDEGKGDTMGWNLVGGVAFLLDWLAPSMAKGFDIEWGVNNSYIFAEYQKTVIDDFGSDTALDLSSDAAFMFGLALEF